MTEPELLLGADEPLPFTIFNETGSAPMMIACDHASNRIPAKLDMLGLSPDLMELHIAYDIGARQVAMQLAERFNAPLLHASYSRLVLDLNRFPDDPAMFPDVSDQHEVPGNRKLENADKQLRIDTLFRPYHDMHSTMVQKLKKQFVKPIIVSIHSFTDQMDGATRPWHFGVLWDRDRALAEQLLENLNQQSSAHPAGLLIGDNKPYHAREPQGYSIAEHAAKQQVEMALIEIRQDLIADDVGQRWAADVLHDVIAPILDSTQLVD